MKTRFPIRILIGWFALSSALAQPGLEVRIDPEGLALEVSGDSSKAQRVEFGDGAEPWAVFDASEGLANWEAPAEMPVSRRLFRVVESVPPAIATHRSWKSTVDLPSDPFMQPDLGASTHVVNWVKFVILLDDPTQVYFQSSADYQFHFNFATERLSPFVGMTASEFEAVSLHRRGQQAVLGAVLVEPNAREFAVQFVGADPYPREMLRFLYQSVETTLNKTGEWRGLLMPVPEHAAAMRADADYFESHGMEVSEPDRWSDQSGCYVEGWAIGRLRYFDHDAIDAAYLSGELLPTDILVTDLVPAELPFVAGILSFSPTTPNSHVAILAESYGIPFAYLEDEAARQRALDLVGTTVALRSDAGFYSCDLLLYDASTVPTAYLDEILALKAPPELELDAKATAGAISVSDLAGKWPADIQHIGGKAANFGFLRRVIPNRSPDAMAFTFDLWDAYLDQPIGDMTLRAEIAARLAPHSSWPADISAVDAALAGIRDLIKGTADFTPAQRSAVLSALSGFSPNMKLRFRSSTNVEDSGVFVGAGLYDSYSGCVADDTDADDVGPSHCDPEQPNERGVFRAMRKVYASFYNRNAFLERLRHGVDESEVGMALLVHPSFPDDIEAANGVATSSYRDLGFSTSIEAEMVSQAGALSVTNPEGGAIPEVAYAFVYRGNFNATDVNLLQSSSLLRLGEDSVMAMDEDYVELGEMFFNLSAAFADHFPENASPRLEFEYKKLTNDDLVIKQMREVPAGDHADAPGIALIDSETHWKLFQGERGSVMGNHRLKSLWTARGANAWFDPSAPVASPVAQAEVEIALDGSVATEVGPPSSWPSHGFVDGRDEWVWSSAAGATSMGLRLTNTGNFQQDPIFALSRFGVEFTADYPAPQLAFDHLSAPTTTEADFAVLVEGHPDDPLPSGSIRIVRDGSDGAVGVRTEFFWPPNPTGPVAGYTAPLEKWVGTTIIGLTTEPLELTGYFSQTYRPGHHNFTEEFLFEPALEEGISAGQLAELATADVQQVYVYFGGRDPLIKIIGLNGAVRDL